MQNVQKRFQRVLTLALLLTVCTVAWAQQRITGTVNDSQGEALVGVTVLEAGTSNGTVTDYNGKFALNVKNGAQLKVSYVGYESQTLRAANGMVVILKEDNTQLDEVVVVGYGTMRRKDVTSSITTVQAKDLNKGVITDISSMLQGKVAGLSITTNGDPNGHPSISLRGASTLRDGAMSPYYVVDGVPGVDISLVSPDDIESIDVLRDASATAIYGSKAANGVIIVTTKSGNKGGRTNVTYNGYVAFDFNAKNLDLADANDIRNYAKANNLDYQFDGGGNTNWRDEVLRTGISHSHNLSINGGNGKSHYMASVTYIDRQGIIDGSHMNRMNARTLMGTKVLNDRLSLDLGLNAMYGQHVGVKMDNEGASVLDAMNYYNPTNPIRGENGNYYVASGSKNYNPLSLIQEDTSETVWKRDQVTAKATLDIIDGLKWTANYSFNYYQSTYGGYDTRNSQLEGIGSKQGLADRSTRKGYEHNFETYGNFDKTFNKVHKVSIMAGYSWAERTKDDGFGVKVHNFLDDQLKWNQLSYAGEIDGVQAVSSGVKETIRDISFYGRIGYSYNSRYMIQATIRRDGSSVFSKDNHWGTFPSVSAAWNITEESFMKNQNVFDNLKLRAGYGVSGNSMGFGAYKGLSTYGANGATFQYNGVTWPILKINQLGNEDLKWETTSMLNIGLDFGFCHNRINGSIEFYTKKTKDLIWDYPISTVIYPINWISSNVGEMNNTGVELTLNVDVVRTKDFNWMTTLNLAHNSNEVKKMHNDRFQVGTFDQGDPMIAGVSANGYTQRVIEGEPLGTFYLWQFGGYDENGKAQYVERNEDGTLTGNMTSSPEYKDRYNAGSAQPKLNLGWNNNITYKNWSLNLFFTGVFGNKIYNGSRAQYTSPELFSTGKNVLKEFINERPATDLTGNIPSDRFLENGSYFRLQTVTLGYTFENLGPWLNSLQVYATCNNAFTITGYKGLDPEVNMGGIAPGIDYRWSNYPHTRTVMAGVKINF